MTDSSNDKGNPYETLKRFLDDELQLRMCGGWRMDSPYISEVRRAIAALNILRLERLEKAKRIEDLEFLVGDLASGLEPLAEKWLWPEDNQYFDPTDEEYVEALADDIAVDEVWIRRRDIRNARALLARANEMISSATNDPDISDAWTKYRDTLNAQVLLARAKKGFTDDL